MKKSELAKLKWRRLRLRPVPREVSDTEEVVAERDELWNVVRADATGLHLSSNGDMTQMWLGSDQVREFLTDAPRGGFLRLKVQVFLRKKQAWIEPLSTSELKASNPSAEISAPPPSGIEIVRRPIP